jgi:phage terminase large subunit-like protein
MPKCSRIVVAVDPAVTSGEQADDRKADEGRAGRGRL